MLYILIFSFVYILYKWHTARVPPSFINSTLARQASGIDIRDVALEPKVYKVSQHFTQLCLLETRGCLMIYVERKTPSLSDATFGRRPSEVSGGGNRNQAFSVAHPPPSGWELRGRYASIYTVVMNAQMLWAYLDMRRTFSKSSALSNCGSNRYGIKFLLSSHQTRAVGVKCRFHATRITKSDLLLGGCI